MVSSGSFAKPQSFKIVWSYTLGIDCLFIVSGSENVLHKLQLTGSQHCHCEEFRAVLIDELLSRCALYHLFNMRIVSSIAISSSAQYYSCVKIGLKWRRPSRWLWDETTHFVDLSFIRKCNPIAYIMFRFCCLIFHQNTSSTALTVICCCLKGR